MRWLWGQGLPWRLRCMHCHTHSGACPRGKYTSTADTKMDWHTLLTQRGHLLKASPQLRKLSSSLCSGTSHSELELVWREGGGPRLPGLCVLGRKLGWRRLGTCPWRAGGPLCLRHGSLLPWLSSKQLTAYLCKPDRRLPEKFLVLFLHKNIV